MQLNELERKVLIQKIEELKEVEEETVRQLRKIGECIFTLKELMRDCPEAKKISNE